MKQLRAISLWQPWASAIALGVKTIETREWVSRYTGPLLIHAAQKKSTANRELFAGVLTHEEIHKAFYLAGLDDYDRLPFGAIVCAVEMTCCRTITRNNSKPLPEHERLLGNYTPGREAWHFESARKFDEPFPCSGRQGFFFVNVPDKLLPASVRTAMRSMEASAR